jgi:hypothetical protein
VLERVSFFVRLSLVSALTNQPPTHPPTFDFVPKLRFARTIIVLAFGTLASWVILVSIELSTVHGPQSTVHGSSCFTRVSFRSLSGLGSFHTVTLCYIIHGKKNRIVVVHEIWSCRPIFGMLER